MNSQLDNTWFEQLRVITSTTDEAEWMQRSLQIDSEERERFFADDIENPLFDYVRKPKTNDLNLEIRSLLDRIAAEEKDAIVLDLYTRKLENQITRNSLLAASFAGEDEQFMQHSVELYGKPTKKYFSYIAKRLQAICKHSCLDDAATRRLCRIVSKINVDNVDIDTDMLPPVVTDSPEITSLQQVRTIFAAALEQYNLTDWELVVDDTGNRTRFSVNNQKKVVNIPGEQHILARSPQLREINIEALAAHEIGVHARRSASGARSPLQLLSIGLDSYLLGEEGVAGYVQQQIEGASEFYGFDRYMAASFAVGLDGEKRDFRGVFSIMVDYYQMKFAHESEVVTDRVKEKAQQAAWEICVRVFRGTSGQTPGCIYTKDLVYLEGNIKMWELVTERPDVFPHLFAGKFSPFNDRHVKSLQTLGLLQEW